MCNQIAFKNHKLTSLWSSCALWLHWNKKGSKSGHSPAGTAYFAMILTTFALARLTGGLQQQNQQDHIKIPKQNNYKYTACVL